MKIKRTLYPKTQRVGKSRHTIFITEKLDGSNLGIFKLDGKLIIAQRNCVYTYPHEGIDYKGLQGWLDKNAEHLLENMHEGSGFFGEWIGMGKIKYGDILDKRMYMFAKANIDENLKVYNLYYNPHLFIYPFVDQEIPEYLGVVPLVKTMNKYPTLEELDQLYLEYTDNALEPKVEGFVINDNDQISKYVRLKDGYYGPHKI